MNFNYFPYYVNGFGIKLKEIYKNSNFWKHVIITLAIFLLLNLKSFQKFHIIMPRKS